MPVEAPLAGLVRQLSRVGLRPDERLVRHILDQGAAARAELLGLATNIAALHEPLPACLGPLHALRLLGELPDQAIIRPLLAALPVPIYDPEKDVAAQLYATEVLQIIGRVGAPAVDLLWAIADDLDQGDSVRSAALNALSYVAAFAPEVRPSLIASMRERLGDESQPAIVTAGAATVLAELGDVASYKAVMGAYRAGRIDQRRTPAAGVRQLMLGGGRGNLDCVKHPLWERYDQHGPTFRPDADGASA
jgi:hypothetical protein